MSALGVQEGQTEQAQYLLLGQNMLLHIVLQENHFCLAPIACWQHLQSTPGLPRWEK